MTHDTHGPGREEIAATIRSCLMSAIGSTMAADLIADDTNLFDIGVDSMNMTDLLLQLEQHFRFMLAPEELSADLFMRFSNLVAFVESHVRRN